MLRALQCNNTIEVINMADNQVEENEKLVEVTAAVMLNNQNCGSYIMKFNDLRDDSKHANKSGKGHH